jgi:hypothetical protein
LHLILLSRLSSPIRLSSRLPVPVLPVPVLPVSVLLFTMALISRGPTRLKSRTLDSEINRNQTRNQEITREISEFWNQKSLKLHYYWAHSLILQR